MRKGLFMFLSVCLSVFLSKAQDCEFQFSLKEGTSMEMTSYDTKDKVASIARQKILKMESRGGAHYLTMRSEVFDKKDKPMMAKDLTLKCEDGVYYMDMNGMMPDLDAYKDMEMKIEGNNLRIPSKLTAGMSLPDADMKVSVSNQGFPVFNTSIIIRDRVVEGAETITTPAGTFDCLKISSNIETKMLITIKSKSVEWFSREVGVVRSESYNSQGKLTGYTVLTSFKR